MFYKCGTHASPEYGMVLLPQTREHQKTSTYKNKCIKRSILALTYLINSSNKFTNL